MKRVGYDADTGRYYFKDRDGAVWQGAEGAEFSEMTKGESIRIHSPIRFYQYFRCNPSFRCPTCHA